ncbi:MAG: hypothetical protein H6739_05115 [Alphaproteobacteria bacterium]|nr:hypothetical protein [Alphaproteobacteria bacterium]
MTEANTGLAMKRLRDALSHEQAGRFEEARADAEAALEAFTEAGDRTGAAASHQLLANLLLETGALAAAMAHLDAATPLRESTGDREGLAALLQARFEIAAHLGDPGRLQADGVRLVRLYEQLSDRPGEARALHQLAQVLIELGRPLDAVPLIERGLWLTDRAGEEQGRSAFLQLQARVDVAEGRQERALRQAREAARIARQAGRRQILVDALYQLGLLQHQAGALAEARASLEESLDGRELLRDLEGRAATLAALGRVEAAMGLGREAVERLTYAARTWAELGEPGQQLEALHEAGETALSVGAVDRALAIAHQQIAAADALGDDTMRAAAWQVAGTRQISVGQLEEAAVSFARCAERRAAAGQPAAQGVALGMLGQILAALGQHELAVHAVERGVALLRATEPSAAAELEAILDELR